MSEHEMYEISIVVANKNWFDAIGSCIQMGMYFDKRLEKVRLQTFFFVSRKLFCSYPVELAGSYVLISWLQRLCDCVEIFQPKHIQFLLQKIHAPFGAF
jgi:hypothetical protein